MGAGEAKLDAAAVDGGTVSEAAEEDRMLGSWSGGSGGTEEGSPVRRFFGPRGMGVIVVSSGCFVGAEAALGAGEAKPDAAAVDGGTVSKAAEEDKMLGSWSGGSGGTEEEGSAVLRFLGPGGVAVVLLAFGSDLEADEAAVGERFPVTRLRGPDETALAAPLEERFMGPEAGPRRGKAL